MRWSKVRSAAFVRHCILRCTDAMHVLSLGTDKILLLLTIHHSVVDGWSSGIIINDLLRAYQSQNLQPPPSFKSHVQLIHSLDRSAAETYWKSRLQDAQPTSLPLALPASAELNLVDRFRTCMSKKLQEVDLDTFAKSRGVTAATVLQTAWSLVLKHYVRRSDVVFGTVLSGRDSGIADVEK